jgi:membrane-associated HD superfamily phosphohydrolase
MRAKKLLQDQAVLKKESTEIEIDEQAFRYPGPIPQTKEIAIISLADIIESSSRTLKKPTPQTIEKHIQEIIDKKVQEGHLNDSQLTFNDLKRIKERFSLTLKTMLHARIEYPKDEETHKTHHDEKDFALKSENE